MLSSLATSKIARRTVTSIAAGATLALVFLGGPADAASAAARGLVQAAGARGL